MAVANLESPLHGTEGDLVAIHISIDPWHLERLLEALSSIAFPVNPEIRHLQQTAHVEFPAYSTRVAEVKDALQAHGFPPALADVKGMLVS